MTYFDLTFTLFIGEYEKTATNRVCADNEKEAILQGFYDEAHNLDEDEIKEAVEQSFKSSGVIEMLDGDIGCRLDSAVELLEVPVVIEGKSVIALLPNPNAMTNHIYFKP